MPGNGHLFCSYLTVYQLAIFANFKRLNLERKR